MTDRNRMLALFEELISIDSPSYGEREIADRVKKKLEALGASVAEDGAGAAVGGSAGNLFARVEGTPGLSPLLFCAHLDTVEPARGKRMRTDENGVIASAGETVLGADDCSGVAAILEGLTALKESGEAHRPLEILFTVAEEPYCGGVQAFDVSRLSAKEAYVFDLAGPVGDAAFQAPTILSFTATFFGKAAHAGFEPENGVHAIQAAAHAVAAIPCGRIGHATFNIGTISGGSANNVVPERCILTGEIRSFSNDEAERILVDVTRSMQKAAAEAGASVTVEHTVHVAAFRTDPDGPVAKRFSAVCGELGFAPRLKPTFGGSDLNFLAQKGVEGLVVASGMNNCHSVDEYTTEDELERAARLALTLMRTKE